MSDNPRLTWLFLAALAFFIYWLISETRRDPKKCPAGKKWDGAPFFPVCQETCQRGNISDGRGQCVSSEIPLTRMHLEDLQAGHLISKPDKTKPTRTEPFSLYNLLSKRKAAK